MKQSIPFLSWPGCGFVVAIAKKSSLLASQFDIIQCREQLVTPLSCFPQPRCNSVVIRTPVLLPLLVDLDTYGGLDPLGVFPLSLNMIAPKQSIIFHRLMLLGSFPECSGNISHANIM